MALHSVTEVNTLFIYKTGKRYSKQLLMGRTTLKH